MLCLKVFNIYIRDEYMDVKVWVFIFQYGKDIRGELFSCVPEYEEKQ